MTDKIYPISAYARERTYCTAAQYDAMYRESLDNPDKFWRENALAFLTWEQPFTSIVDSNMETGDAKWFDGGKLNVSVNCIDRHLTAHANKTAIIFEGDEPGNAQHISYQALHDHVCRLANVLKAQGVKKGDRVCIYLPMIAEAAYAMLACARIGAIHSVVFGGFSSSALRDRIIDAGCKVVITADESVRGGKATPLKNNVDVAIQGLDFVDACVVVKRTGADVEWSERDIWYHEAVSQFEATCTPEAMDSEDPLFILYTSGSTGKPKGVLHTTAGYLLHAAMTFKYSFDNFDDEVFWCTADVGWVTGHTYVVYGPLANASTSLMFEGVPTYPDAGRCWQVVEEQKVAQFYTAPTAIRALMAQGDDYVTRYDRSSLRLLGSVGEPINPEAWEWYYRVVGEERCSMIDTWWQTETGGQMMLPLPGACPPKPGAASKPFFGIEPVLLDTDGQEIEGAGEGALAIKRSWPAQIRSVYGDHQRMYDTYFSTFKGYYFTGDGARLDDDGYWWITGRMDDVLNVSGHRMGTAEIESAIVAHEATAEAAVVGYPHDLKGQGVYAYVILKDGIDASEQIKSEIIALCRKEIGPIAKPDVIHFSKGLPKTRSGKIMRRILRKIACDEVDSLGDTSTLIDPSVVDYLIDTRENRAAEVS